VLPQVFDAPGWIRDPPGPDAQMARIATRASTLVQEAITSLDQATSELRELSRGIRPAVLTEIGLRAVVDVLAAHTTVPAEVDCSISGRLPAAIEAAAYCAVAER
jgi:signal transduction histidine kinase